MFKGPKLVEYFDTSFECKKTEYVVFEDQKDVFLCSTLCYRLAKDISRENELETINTRSLPVDWCHYKVIYHTKYPEYIPSIIENNYEKILEIANDNFESISRIADFLSEFCGYKCKKNFKRSCGIAWAITRNYISEELLQKLFNLVFEYYHELVEENKFNLLFDNDVCGFLIVYEEQKTLKK